ncbi:MAG: GNAT family N-acetyltransferase [Ahrensia sp.]|nr:GNAT family N-acetyltransferase [Ahrensia sp.]
MTAETKRDDITIRVVDAADAIDAQAWDALANPADPQGSAAYDRNPFLRHAFFSAAERSGSARRETGWLPQHLVMERKVADAVEIIGILPCYLKGHSQGEYVFDHGWADAYERAGGRYYPKLQATVPFTPAAGRRILVGNGEDADSRRLLMADGLQEVCDRHSVSSAHITFMEKHEWDLLGQHNFLKRTDQQFHWVNDGYRDFDAFLTALSSRKRKTIRKERASALANNGISIEWLTGAALTEAVWDTFFEFYMDTGSRKWGRPYLTRQFYSMIGETMADDILLIMAKREGRYVAGAINFVGSHRLFGRHWGCVEDHPFLHFEVCYYQAIDYAIAHGLSRVEAGAQGAHKLARGYMPTLTHSAHYLPNPDFRRAVEDYLDHERRAVERESKLIADHGPFRKSS